MSEGTGGFLFGAAVAAIVAVLVVAALHDVRQTDACKDRGLAAVRTTADGVVCVEAK